MDALYLLIAGLVASLTHAYLVWHHRANRRYSISEHAILDKKSHALYLVAHIVCDIFVLLYAHQFFLLDQNLTTPFYLLVIFAVLDFAQAALPSRGNTERVHFAAAYVSWFCYMAAGLVALIQVPMSALYGKIAGLLFLPLLGMFIYMHINRSKLYPYQLLMVPLYTVFMLVITIGAVKF